MSEINGNSFSVHITFLSSSSTLLSPYISLYLFLPFCQLASLGKGSVSVNWTERTGTELVESCWLRAHCFLQPGRKKGHIPVSQTASVPPLIPCLPNYPSVFFVKGEPWMRLTKAFCKSPSWLPSMSTVLGVRGRTNYIHSQHTLLLHNRDSAWIQ